MIIYLDRVFLLNGLVDYLLLSLCGRLTALLPSWRRLGLAAALGGIYAAGCLFPPWGFLAGLPGQLLFALGLCRLAFGGGPGLLRRTGVFLLLSAAFSGLVLVLTEVFSAPASLISGRVYYPIGMGALVLTAGGSFALMRWALGRFSHQGGDILPVEVRLLGRSVSFTALRDTGNTLKDPISGKAVAVADPWVLEQLLPDAKGLCPQDPAAMLSALKARHPGLSLRLVPYRTIGADGGLLLVLRPDNITVDGIQQPLLLGVSPVPLDHGDGYKALLGGSLP